MLSNLRFKEFIRAMGFMKTKMWLFFISVILTGVSSVGLLVINSFMYKNVVNGAVYGEGELLSVALKLMLAAILLVCVVTPVTSYLSMYLCNRTMLEIRSKTYTHLLKLPKKYFHAKNSGEILSRITNDLDTIRSIYAGDLYFITEVFLNGIVSLVVIFILDWRLSLIIITLGLLSFIINIQFAKPIQVISSAIQALVAKVNQRFLDIIAGNRVVKLFNIHSIILNLFKVETDNLTNQNIKLIRKDSEKEGINFALSGLSFLGVFGVGAFMVGYKMIDPGTVIAIFALKNCVDELFMGIGSSLSNMQKSLAGVTRLFELLDHPEEYLNQDTYLKHSTPVEGKSAHLTIENLTFSYGEGKPSLSGINMLVEKEKVTALVGLSGAGKSTIIKLLMGLYTPQSGTIKFYGLDDENISLDSLRQNLAYVSQDAYLFDCTIEENIRYGNPQATKAQIIEAAKVANAHDFILTFPQGYDTKVGENSARLSGGQRQRIAIARALLKNAPILLLDEATSALDAESDALVQQALKRLMIGRTTIVIAHRLSTIQYADIIYVVEQGKIVDSGKHQELLSRDGVYKLLYKSQFHELAG